MIELLNTEHVSPLWALIVNIVLIFTCGWLCGAIQEVKHRTATYYEAAELLRLLREDFENDQAKEKAND